VGAVLDFPMVAGVGGDVLGSGQRGRQVGDPVDDLFAVPGAGQITAMADDAEDLSGVREVDAGGRGDPGDAFSGTAVPAPPATDRSRWGRLVKREGMAGQYG
jgi:hypothetical protein